MAFVPLPPRPSPLTESGLSVFRRLQEMEFAMRAGQAEQASRALAHRLSLGL